MPAPSDATLLDPALLDPPDQESTRPAGPIDAQLADHGPDARVPSMVLSYGLGVDSTAILVRWLLEPDSRDFDLADLAVVTAMVGDEWTSTGVDVTTHILPLLRAHGVRFVQAARGRRNVTVAGDGVVVLDDSTAPTRVHLEGVYRLSDELREAGTVAQVSGARLCSVHAKGDVLDPVIAALTRGRPYRHAIGFEADETSRATKDAGYNTSTRTGVYPLLDWGWDRAACEAYLERTLGVRWNKSACVACPFALANKAGRVRTLARYADSPAAGVATLMLEHVALALNPAQGILGPVRAVDLVAEAGLDHVLAAFAAELDATPHALYEVRRIIRPRRDDPTKVANASRSVRCWDTGTRAEMLARLKSLAADPGAPGDGPAAGVGALEVGPDGIGRVYRHRRGVSLPASEHFLVVAPVGVLDKEQPKFATWWAELHPDPLPAAGAQLALL